MQSNSFVSIVMPAFNAETYIEESIQSVLDQDFKSFELIVVNDGSTDRTKDIALSFSDSRIRLISQVNTGHAGARNRGIKESNGEFIAFIDADDIWLPNKLSKQVSFLNKNEEYGMIYSRGEVVDSKGQYIRQFSVFGPEGFILNKLLLNASLIHISSVLIRKEVFNRLGGFDIKISSYEDWNLWLRIAIHYQIGYIKDVLFKIRFHDEGNTARTFREKYYLNDVLYTINQIFQLSRFLGNLRPKKYQVLSYAYKMEGFRNMYFHQIKKARKYFILSIKYYPMRLEVYIAFLYTLLGPYLANFIHQKVYLSLKGLFLERLQK